MNSAIASLVERHHQVLGWFEDYNAADSNVRKQEIASGICRGLQAQIAREPASDHAIITRLAEEVLKSSPIDELFDSKVRILGDAFAQHVGADATTTEQQRQSRR